MVADLQERGLSYTETTCLINTDCIKHGRKTVTRSAVRTCKNNMVREVSNIEKQPQGNKDADVNGEYHEEKKAFQVRFPEQGRFCFGVAIVDCDEGPVGEHAHLFDYTCKEYRFYQAVQRDGEDINLRGEEANA